MQPAERRGRLVGQHAAKWISSSSITAAHEQPLCGLPLPGIGMGQQLHELLGRRIPQRRWQRPRGRIACCEPP